MKEDRRVSLTTKGNKKVMSLTQLVTLTGSQEEKLNCKQLLPELEKIAKKLEIDWAVELSANIEYGTLAVSRTYEKEIGNYEFSSIEKAAKDFLSDVDKLKLPKPEPECPNHDNAAQVNAEKLAFVDSLIEDEEEIRKNFRGIDIMAPYKGMPFAESICSMTLDTWFELLKTYSVFHHGDN